MNATERILEQGKVVVCAIASLETVTPCGPIGRITSWLLPQAYCRPLRAIVRSAPLCLAEEILSAGLQINGERPAIWLSEN